MEPFTLTVSFEGQDTELEFVDLSSAAPELQSRIRFALEQFMSTVPDWVKCDRSEDFTGDLGPKTFGILKGDEVIGAWSLFRVRRIEGGPAVEAMFISALPGVGTEDYDEPVRAILAQLLGVDLQDERAGGFSVGAWRFPESVPDVYRDRFLSAAGGSAQYLDSRVGR